jgi:hypothetical protein
VARPRPLVRLLAAATGLLLFLVVLELGSALAVSLIDRKAFSYARLFAEREQLRTQDAPGALGTDARALPPSAPRAGGGPGHPARTPAIYVPHPFFGFALDPTAPELAAARAGGAMDVGADGFFDSGPPGEVNVGLFGGSVAVYACVDGAEALRQALQAVPELHGRRIAVQCIGLGGFKQPQMLGALSYLLASGRRFDAVLLLDGFNDVALAFNQNKFKRAAIAYPYDWERHLGPGASREDQRRVGLVVALGAARAELAGAFQDRRLGRSAAGGLLWRVLDRALAARLQRARADLGQPAPGQLGYRELGPLEQPADDVARMREVARVWADSSRTMAALCAGSGIRFHHFLQPNQYDPGSKPLTTEERRAAFREDSAFRPPIELGYPVLRVEAAKLAAAGVPFTDLSGIFAHTAEALYVDDCCHVNPRGSALLGAAMGERLAADWARATPPPRR